MINVLRNILTNHRADPGKLYHNAFAATENAKGEKLARYHYVGCPFCTIARAPLERLGIDVELRDISQDPAHHDDLVRARGRATVPVLRITSPDGEDRWMPESRDIVHYLETAYA